MGIKLQFGRETWFGRWSGNETSVWQRDVHLGMRLQFGRETGLGMRPQFGRWSGNETAVW